MKNAIYEAILRQRKNGVEIWLKDESLNDLLKNANVKAKGGTLSITSNGHTIVVKPGTLSITSNGHTIVVKPGTLSITSNGHTIVVKPGTPISDVICSWQVLLIDKKAVSDDNKEKSPAII